MVVNVGFTGTQDGCTNKQRDTLNNILLAVRDSGVEHLHHGDCIGADALADNLWKQCGGKTIAHPPFNPKKRAFCVADVILPERDYMDRNEDIVKSTQILVATPKGMTEELRSGTWATIRRARERGRPICIIYPNGTYTTEGPWLYG